MSINSSNSILNSPIIGVQHLENKKMEIDELSIKTQVTALPFIPKSPRKKTGNHKLSHSIKKDLSNVKINSITNLAGGLKHKRREQLSTNLAVELNDDILKCIIILSAKNLFTMNLVNIHPFLTVSKLFYKNSIAELVKLTNLGEITWNMNQFSNFSKNNGTKIQNFNFNDFSPHENFRESMNNCPKLNTLTLRHITLNDDWISSISTKKDLKKICLISMDFLGQNLQLIVKKLPNLRSIELKQTAYGFNDNSIKKIYILANENLINRNGFLTQSLELVDCFLDEESLYFLNKNFIMVESSIMESYINPLLFAPIKGARAIPAPPVFHNAVRRNLF